MQVFEALEIKEFPYMSTREILEGNFVGDVINEENEDKVFIIIDHDKKRILTYNGSGSPYKTQIYGGILATYFRKQLKLFYRVTSLNALKKGDEFQEILEKPLGGGRARSLEEGDFLKTNPGERVEPDLETHAGVKINRALDYIEEEEVPEGYIRKFMIVGNNIYVDEQETHEILQEEKQAKKKVKMGQLNRGFNFFDDHVYSTRLIIKERKIQAFELFIREGDEKPPLELKTPILFEEKFSRHGDMKKLMEAFQIPDTLPDEE